MKAWCVGLAGVLLAGALGIFSRPAVADVSTFRTSGYWRAFGGTANDGTEVCGMSTDFKDGRYFGIKRYGHDNFLTIQALKPGWHFGGGRVRVRFHMNRTRTWSAKASTTRGGNTLEFTIPILEIKDFLEQFVNSPQLDLVMGNNRVEWVINLRGSKEVAHAFSHCIGEM